MSRQRLRHEFVDFIPDDPADGVVYISTTYATATHRCACGCRAEIVTPLSPADWSVTFNGESISLQPSIGNWSYPCQSHYWIKGNEVHWSDRWTPEQIATARARNEHRKLDSFAVPPAPPGPTGHQRGRASTLTRIRERLRRR